MRCCCVISGAVQFRTYGIYATKQTPPLTISIPYMHAGYSTQPLTGPVAVCTTYYDLITAYDMLS